MGRPPLPRPNMPPVARKIREKMIGKFSTIIELERECIELAAKDDVKFGAGFIRHIIAGHTKSFGSEKMAYIARALEIDPAELIEAGNETMGLTRTVRIPSKFFFRMMGRDASPLTSQSEDDAMAPTINNGDVALYDPRDKDIREGVFMFKDKERLFPRRVIRGTDQRLMAAADNVVYGSQVISEMAGVTVAGRVVAIIKPI